MKRAHLAIVGFGPLGHACALALLDAGDLELAGVVRRSGGALPRHCTASRSARTCAS